MSSIKVCFILHNPNGEYANLQMRVRWGSAIVSINVGYSICIDKWDRGAQLCKQNTSHGPNRIPASIINKRIREYRSAAESLVRVFNSAPSREDLKGALLNVLGRQDMSERTSPKISAVMTDYIIRQSVRRSWSPNTIRKQKSLMALILEWDSRATLDSFDMSGLDSFHLFLLGKGHKNSTVEKYLILLRGFLRWCASKSGGYEVKEDYKEFQPEIKTTQKTIIWLTWEEVLQLYRADLSGMNKRSDNHAEEIRDMFCFSCFTGLRYSDVASLRHSDIINDKIAPISLNKTTERVTIELNKYSREILHKYENFDVVSALPSVSNAKCNKVIKEICRYVGITRDVTLVYYQRGDRIEETKKICDVVSFHVGRKSFICSALEKGISPLVVMKWTGHSDYEEMKPYIDISDKAKANAMKLFDI